MSAPLVADTGGLLRALARRPDGRAAWPEYEDALRDASAVVVPALILAEVDYFLRTERTAMRKLIREIVDPATTYELEPVSASDLARALQLDAKFHQLQIGLVDGLVAAVAERRRVFRILTTDRRDFSTLRVGTRYSQPLTLLP
ncbi:MAG TPA: PIN domain-containing protein [Myxococcales bacterium]|nr:PIN domain-containing protein [Myxococcales bacterium]